MRGLLSGLVEAGFGGSLQLLVDTGLPGPELPADLPVAGVRRRWHGRLALYEDAVVLGGDLARVRPALFHATATALPSRPPCPVVATVHDLIPWALGGPALRGERLRYWPVRRLLASADGVIAVSESTARDAVRLAGVERSRVRVVPEGVAGTFRPREGAQHRLKERWGIEPPYLLYVGALDVRKDPLALVRAWRAAQAAGAGCGLVVAGEAGAQAPPDNYLAGVRALGHVAEEQLADLYSAAACFLYPSRYEGFGLPVLEALACGCPVASYANSSLLEVGGEVADLVRDGDADALGRAAARYVMDPASRASVGRRGRAHASRYTWLRAARATVAAYEAIISGP